MLKEYDITKSLSELVNFRNFIKLLILDVSPCLQKGIITVLIEFFRKITPNSEQILENLLNYNMFDYLLYNYSIALIDVRCYIMAFFKVLLSYRIVKENTGCKSEITYKVIPFILQNLFPTNLKAFKKDVLIKEQCEEDKINILGKKTKVKRGSTFDVMDSNSKIESLGKKNSMDFSNRENKVKNFFSQKIFRLRKIAKAKNSTLI